MKDKTSSNMAILKRDLQGMVSYFLMMFLKLDAPRSVSVVE